MGILICGLNGTGKSTLGKMLADRIGYEFITFINAITPAAGMSTAASVGIPSGHAVGHDTSSGIVGTHAAMDEYFQR